MDHMVFDGMTGDTELSRNFVIGALLFPAKPEDFARPGREALYSAVEKVLVLAAEHGVVGGTGRWAAQSLPADRADGGLAAAGGLQGVDRTVTRDDKKEGLERLEVAEFRPLLPDLQENFLREIFGELGEFDELQDELGEGVPVRVEQGSEASASPAASRANSAFSSYGEGADKSLTRLMRGKNREI
jgi:hypothetical protein